jgi:hypothetical protein
MSGLASRVPDQHKTNPEFVRRGRRTSSLERKITVVAIEFEIRRDVKFREGRVAPRAEP